MFGPAIEAVNQFLVEKRIKHDVAFDELTPRNDMQPLVASMKQHAEYALRQYRLHGNTPEGIRFLALSMVIEETQELVSAVLAADRTETMDALGDTLYVLLGLSLRLRLPAIEAFMAVHTSNMTKAPATDNDGRLDGDRKGPDFVPPTFPDDHATGVPEDFTGGDLTDVISY